MSSHSRQAVKKSRTSIGLRVAWCVVVVHALAYARFAVEYSMQVKYQYLAGGLCVIAISGTLLRWGPPVLFALAGFYAGTFWIPSPYLYTHDALEGLMEDFGHPAIYAIIGAIAGILWGLARRPPTSGTESGGSTAPSNSESHRAATTVT